MTMACRMRSSCTVPSGANYFLSLPTLEGEQTHLNLNILEVAFITEQIFASTAIVRALDDFKRFVVVVKGDKNIHLADEDRM